MAIRPEKVAKIPLLEPEIYVGTCYAVIDLGKQYNEWNKKIERHVMLSWEITDEYIEIDGKKEPKVISKEYAVKWTPSSGFRGLIESWFGKDVYDEDTVEARICLGKSCQIDIALDKKESGEPRNKVQNITRLAKGQQAHTPKELLYYEFDDPSTYDVFDKLPEWIQKVIQKSVDYKNIVDIPAEPPQGEISPLSTGMTPISTDTDGGPGTAAISAEPAF